MPATDAKGTCTYALLWRCIHIRRHLILLIVPGCQAKVIFLITFELVRKVQRIARIKFGCRLDALRLKRRELKL